MMNLDKKPVVIDYVTAIEATEIMGWKRSTSSNFTRDAKNGKLKGSFFMGHSRAIPITYINQLLEEKGLGRYSKEIAKDEQGYRLKDFYTSKEAENLLGKFRGYIAQNKEINKNAICLFGGGECILKEYVEKYLLEEKIMIRYEIVKKSKFITKEDIDKKVFRIKQGLLDNKETKDLAVDIYEALGEAENKLKNMKSSWKKEKDGYMFSEYYLKEIMYMEEENEFIIDKEKTLGVTKELDDFYFEEYV